MDAKLLAVSFFSYVSVAYAVVFCWTLFDYYFD